MINEQGRIFENNSKLLEIFKLWNSQIEKPIKNEEIDRELIYYDGLCMKCNPFEINNKLYKKIKVKFNFDGY